MKNFLLFSFMLSLVFSPAYSESLSREEVVGYANRIMKNIYNDIWRIRSRYPELKDFGPQNLSDTMELSSYYVKIKKLRIKSAESEARHRFFREEEFRGDKDTLYITFSETPKVHGTIAIPVKGFKISDLDLYLLIYTNSENQFFKHDMVNIVGNNAVMTEAISY